MDKIIIFYISGHGFGHSSRMAEVIRILLQREPGLSVVVKTSAPEWFFREHIPANFQFHCQEYDTGVMQSNSLNLDALQTLKTFAAFLNNQSGLLAAESKFIHEVAPALIVGDIPPLAFEIAAAGGVPSLAVANFSWDWIYEPYLNEHPEFGYILSSIRNGYRSADLLLRLPFAGEMPFFRPVIDIPLIARKSLLPRQKIRALLSLPRNKPAVLFSFGGFSLGEKYYRQITKIPGFVWIASEQVGFNLPAINNFDRKQLKTAGLGYPDLVKAADIVITKPGYGILAECIANQTKMLYTDRGNFREHPILVKGIARYLPARFISQEKLKSGDLKEELFELLEAKPAFPFLPLDGAETCAKIILERISG